jgi:hypothetical protein
MIPLRKAFGNFPERECHRGLSFKNRGVDSLIIKEEINNGIYDW